MGNLLQETGNYNNANKYYKQALVHNPKEMHALIGLGNTLFETNQAKEAIPYY